MQKPRKKHGSEYISEKKMLEYKIDKNGNGNCYTCMGCRSFLTPYVDENGKPKSETSQISLSDIGDAIGKVLPDFLKKPSTWGHLLTGNWTGLLREMFFHKVDPLALDLNGNGIETLAANGHDGAMFDHERSGIRTATGWIHSNDGILVHDRNGDGKITANEWIKLCPGFDVAEWLEEGMQPLPDHTTEEVV